MKVVSVVRHAKSSWENPNLIDFERPLLSKVLRRTETLAAFLKAENRVPDCVLSSTALRARKTSEYLIQLFDRVIDLRLEESFYPGRIDSFEKVIKKLDSNINHVMVVGHNPVLTDWVNSILNQNLIAWIKTSGLICLGFETKTWNRMFENNGKIIYNVMPKQLASEGY